MHLKIGRAVYPLNRFLHDTFNIHTKYLLCFVKCVVCDLNCIIVAKIPISYPSTKSTFCIYYNIEQINNIQPYNSIVTILILEVVILICKNIIQGLSKKKKKTVRLSHLYIMVICDLLIKIFSVYLQDFFILYKNTMFK